MWQEVATKYQELIPSLSFTIIHALTLSYFIVQQLPKANLFKLLVATFTVGFGGGIITSLMQGQPISLIFDNQSLFIYGFMTIFVAKTGLHTFIDRHYKTVFKPWFVVIDAITRAFWMPSFLIDLRAQRIGLVSGKDAIIAQLVLTTIYCTGGGFLFFWSFKGQELAIGGWYLRVIFFTTAVLILLFNIMESSNGSMLYGLYELLQKYYIDFDSLQLQDFQLFTATLVTVGFLVRDDFEELADDYVFVSQCTSLDRESSGEDSALEESSVSAQAIKEESESNSTNETLDKPTPRKRKPHTVATPETRRSTRSRPRKD